jgi:hypothetical protein
LDLGIAIAGTAYWMKPARSNWSSGCALL